MLTTVGLIGSEVANLNAHQSTVSTWLADAGRTAGHALSMSEDGHCTVSFGDGLQCVVEVSDQSDLVFFYVPLVDLPEDDDLQLALLKRALELNLFGLETGGAHLSFDERTDTLLLSFSAPIDALDSELFSSLLGDVLNAAVRLFEKF